MSVLEPLPSGFRARTETASRLLPACLGLAIFLSAFLLFGVQPMFTKMVLPTLGGSPAVWSVAMAFFQALLLLGYLYAHLSGRWLSGAQALAVHAVLLAAAFVMLPLAVSGLFGSAPDSSQGLWLFGVFAASVGVPFFALSATAPLLQSWFARSGHPEAANPYKLYVASNVGSFSALIVYPLIVEPLVPLRLQNLGWTALFAALACGLAACGALLLRNRDAIAEASAPRPDAPIATWPQRAVWTGLAAVPSGLLVSVTAHLSTDVASAPLLWVLPLALFLLTFILAFRDEDLLGMARMGKGFARIVPLVVMSLLGFVLPLSIQYAIHLGVLFLAAMLCHRLLYLKRPAAAGLTEFYLWMSFGGMLGGLFAGLLAPLLFDTIIEYRLLLIAALLCAPTSPTASDRRRQLMFVAVALPAAVGYHLAAPLIQPSFPILHYGLTLAVCTGLLIIVLLNRHGPIANGGAAAAAFIVGLSFNGAPPAAVVRSFFGVNYVRVSATGDYRQLMHGSTLHGAHRFRGLDGKLMVGRPQPTTYYHDGGGINLALLAARARAGGRLPEVAMIGLGAGAMACQSARGENWTFFEIDSEVVELAKRRELFPFMSTCAPDARIVIGDGRLTLQKETTRFDAIILDAFSSDAVPAHLLTREAFAGYADRLKPGGVIIAHVSNRYMDLRGVAEAAGLGQGMSTVSAHIPTDPADRHQALQLATPTTVVAMSRDTSLIDALIEDKRWERAEGRKISLQWTDDYANIPGAMLRSLGKRWRGEP